MGTATFAYGSLYGPVVESDKTDLDTLAYGSLYGPVVGVETGAPAATGQPMGLRRELVKFCRTWSPGRAF